MKRKRFVAVWEIGGSLKYCNLDITRFEVDDEKRVVRVYDMDMMTGQFDLGFIELFYVTECL